MGKGTVVSTLDRQNKGYPQFPGCHIGGLMAPGTGDDGHIHCYHPQEGFPFTSRNQWITMICCECGLENTYMGCYCPTIHLSEEGHGPHVQRDSDFVCLKPEDLEIEKPSYHPDFLSALRATAKEGE